MKVRKAGDWWRTLAAVGVLAAAVLPPRSCRAAAPGRYDLDDGRETALTAAGAGLLLTGLARRGGLEPLTAEELAALDARTLPALDRLAVHRWSPAADLASDVLVWTLSAAPVGLVLAQENAGRSERGAIMYAETMLLSGGATVLLKHATGRPRPYAYNDDPRIPDALRRSRSARTSFPSGHTAQAFAAMTFFATVHRRWYPHADAGWVWAGCLGSAAATGVLRVESGRHFPTDVLAGAALGAAIGWLVPRLHEDDTVPDPAGGPPLPVPLRIGIGFAF